jgi:hypothetical protein
VKLRLGGAGASGQEGVYVAKFVGFVGVVEVDEHKEGALGVASLEPVPELIDNIDGPLFSGSHLLFGGAYGEVVEPLGKAKVFADQCVFAKGRGFVAPVPESLGQGSGGLGENHPAREADAVVFDGLPGQQGGVGGQGPGRRRIGSCVELALLGQGIKSGCRVQAVAIGRNRIGAQGVDDHQQNGRRRGRGGAGASPREET